MRTSVAHHKAQVHTIVAMFNTGDVAAAPDVFAPTYLDHQRPAGLDLRGPEEFAFIVAAARGSLPNLAVRIEALLGEADSVVARLRWSSVDPSGSTVERETIEILRFEQGYAIEHWGAEAWRTTTTPARAASGA